MIRLLAKHVPDFLRPAARSAYESLMNAADMLKTRNDMTPPRSMIFVGGGDFEKIGQEFKAHFIELGGLQPEHRVLDVGCGIGRMAVPLTDYLSAEGGYWGFDIVKKGIVWCQENISTKFSNFQFQHSDIYNKFYNAEGTILAKDYRFPFEDEFFDFVFLTSVFTHMLPGDLENYLSEISRVMKPRGKCLITFFVLNRDSESLVQTGRGSQPFKYKLDGCLTVDETSPEVSIAYKEETIEQLFRKYNLTINRPIQYGSWCGRDSFLSYQDLIIATKNEPATD